LFYEKDDLVGKFPGIIARVMSAEGKPVSIHRTFLTHEGQKAPVDSPKKLCKLPSDQTLQGAAIRLFKAGPTLAVAEGIETSLAVTQMTGTPCWATVSAALMAEFIPPKGVTKLVVYADKDRPVRYHPKGHGQEAAMVLVHRMWKLGIQARIELPPCQIPEGKKGIDWLDVLVDIQRMQHAA
jgi:hypothetical protein